MTKLTIMDIIALPTTLNLKESRGLQLYEYEISDNNPNQKVDLSQNVISFVLEGSKKIIAECGLKEINADSFVMIKEGSCIMTETCSSSSKQFKSLLFFFSTDIIQDFLKKYNLTFDDDKSSASLKVFYSDNYTKNIVDSLFHLIELNTDTRNRILHIKFEELMLYLISKHGISFLQTFADGSNDEQKHFLEVVEKNKLNKLNISELAFLSNMSSSTFKRVFKDRFNESPIKWFTDQRLENAAYLLKQKRKRPSDIYEEIGYTSLSNFIQAFKIKYGETPKEHRVA